MVLKQKVQGHVEELSQHIKASFGVAGSRVSGLFVLARHPDTHFDSDLYSWNIRNYVR